MGYQTRDQQNPFFGMAVALGTTMGLVLGLGISSGPAWAQSTLSCDEGSSARAFYVSAQPTANGLEAIEGVALGGSGTFSLLVAQQAGETGYRSVSVDETGLSANGVKAELIAADFSGGSIGFRACTDEGFLVAAVYLNSQGQVAGAPSDVLGAQHEVNYANVTAQGNRRIGLRFNDGGAESALGIISAQLKAQAPNLEPPRVVAELVLTENITNVFDFAESQAPVYGFTEGECEVRDRVVIHKTDQNCVGKINPAVSKITVLEEIGPVFVSDGATFTSRPDRVFVATITQSSDSRDVVFASRFEQTFPKTFSNDPANPTPLTFKVGDNTISGQVADPRNTRDFVTFTVPDGHELTSIFLIDWAAVGDNIGFAHIDEGKTTVIPAQETILDFLGGAHVSRALFGPTDNMLTALSEAAQGGTGFDTPLPSGDYTFNIQQTGPQESGYTLNFVIEKEEDVPPPRTYSVSNSGASAYVIDGSNNPALTLVRGRSYVFDVNAPGHPFLIKTQKVAGSGSTYNGGVTGNGLAVGQITFTVPMNAPNQLFYICQFHGSMAGNLNIVDP